uniref:Uncharacterized protein n=1 Tax=Oryza punctata TaxID=4537 RepID=A0A0E0LBV5_ORYPU
MAGSRSLSLLVHRGGGARGGWLCLHWLRRRRHRPSAPPRWPLAIPGYRDDTTSAQDGARDMQWRQCGDPNLIFAELGWQAHPHRSCSYPWRSLLGR